MLLFAYKMAEIIYHIINQLEYLEKLKKRKPVFLMNLLAKQP